MAKDDNFFFKWFLEGWSNISIVLFWKHMKLF